MAGGIVFNKHNFYFFFSGQAKVDYFKFLSRAL